MFNPQSIITEPFDFKATKARNGKFMLSFIKLSFGQADPNFDDETMYKHLVAFMTDSAKAVEEVERLYKVLDGQKRRHLPLPGVPGAPVKCVSCSMHGAEVLWPCEPYKAADAALPEGWPL